MYGPLMWPLSLKRRPLNLKNQKQEVLKSACIAGITVKALASDNHVGFLTSAKNVVATTRATLALAAAGPFVGERGGHKLQKRPPLKQQLALLSEADMVLAYTPVRLPELVHWLQFYPNREAAAYLQEGFSSGFRIPVATVPVARNPVNQQSVTSYGRPLPGSSFR